jgi:sugar lactone lactonase YvrE
MREPNDCWLDGKGGLLIADIQDQRVRRLDLNTGIIDTFAGDGEKRRTGDGKLATEASLMGPRAVCMDSKGIPTLPSEKATVSARWMQTG